MDRRQFLRNSALLALGTLAADQLELLERLNHQRKFFPSATVHHRQRLDNPYATDPNAWFVEFNDHSNARFLLLPRSFYKARPLITIGQGI